MQSTAESIRSDIISVCVMVNMLPNRYSDKFGAYPGVRKVRIMPNAIPRDQNTAIAESSLTPCLSDNHFIPNAENIENIIAEIMGLKPKKKPIPSPPNDAWVMPPLMKTKRRETTYVPIMPQAMLAKRLPKRALRKKA